MNLVLIVAKCNVNGGGGDGGKDPNGVLIVAKCNVNAVNRSGYQIILNVLIVAVFKLKMCHYFIS